MAAWPLEREEEGMKRLGIMLGSVGTRYLQAQQPALKRMDLLRTAVAEMDGQEAHMWRAR